MAVQTNFSINPPAGEPNKVVPEIDVATMEQARIDNLKDRLNAYPASLKPEFGFAGYQIKAL